MAEYDYDLFVIGAGSGGVRAARMAANKGQRVAVAEERALGGTCVNVGCVPKKLFYYGSHFSEDFHDAASYGWDVKVKGFDWPTLRDNKTREIERLNGIYDSLLGNAGVEIMAGRASIVDPNTIRVGDRNVTAKHILIATGGWPFVPDIPGKEHAITSNEAFYLEQFPQKIVIVGGGYIAVEFAGIFKGLGAEVDLIYRGPMFLRGFDDDIRHFVAQQMQAKGIRIHFETNVESIASNGTGFSASLSNGNSLEADQVMYATGRRAFTDGLGLENTAVETRDNGSIIVDDKYRTAEPSIYALGDVVGGWELTPVALAEAMVLVHNLYSGEAEKTLDYSNIPTAVFCQPNIGTVGMTEAEAREQYEVDIYRSSFRALKHTLTDNNERTLMKMIVDRASDRVVGVHMAGPEAGEMIQGIAIAIKAGATKAVFDQTIGIHPTAAEEFVTMREPVKE